MLYVQLKKHLTPQNRSMHRYARAYSCFLVVVPPNLALWALYRGITILVNIPLVPKPIMCTRLLLVY